MYRFDAIEGQMVNENDQETDTLGVHVRSTGNPQQVIFASFVRGA